ncbi:DsbE family thiol:disulfide interchange protein [Azohydromonas lata]|uniref:DsbE family thiol:disulfide interchange protein n=1 Tax=Azohydromonas lata TaxID=45677 RepID=A0ABU5IPY5_9BURK|nr:DsbE family thiol:disulfide interchange protein [Azohydromonas lata]MDZ5460956.1 DsbE family thiol:disulfide interchange protein [Azohydromonas lata]
MDSSPPSPLPGAQAGPRRRRALVPLTLLALLGLLVLLMARGLQRDPHALPSALVGQRAPALALPPLDPGQPPAASALLGRPWVLNVWASWCEPCTQEWPQLQQLAAQGVAVVGLNYKDDAAAARRWLQRAGRSPFETSLQDADGRAALDWGVSGVPETFIVDAQGVVRWRHAGALTPQVLQEQFWPLWRKFQP